MPSLTPPGYISAYRTLMRILLFAGIVALTGWLTFTTYSAKRNGAKTDTPTQSGSSATPVDRAGHVDIDKTYGKLPLTFEANLGQSDPSVKYIARGPGYNIFLTPAEAVLVFPDRGAAKESATQAEAAEELRPGAEFEDRHLDRSRRGPEQQAAKERKAPVVVRIQLVGANPNPQAVEGRDERPGKVNYFIGDDSSKWVTSIPTFGKVAYSSVYPGVDLVYYGNRHQLEYDLVVAPGTDPSVIQINFEGADGLRVDKRGDLLLQTKAGEIRQTKPSIFQEVNGARKQVEGSYVLRRGNKVGFKISRYDRRKALVIDPILNYFSIANNSGNGHAIAVDAQGFAYITGTVQDALFNPTPGGFQQVSGGNFDGFVTKISLDGTDCIYSTYIGGTGFDESYGIAVDGQGNAHITGYAETGFPVTAGAFQTTLADSTDAFITKLNSTGSALLYSTFFGGNGFEEGDSIKLDGAGNAYVVGLTESTNLPISAGAGQTAARGGYDAFVMSLNSAGSALRYSTYFGGGGQDYGLSIAIDSATNAYITGITRSLNLSTVNSVTSPGGLDLGLFKSVDSGSSWSLSRNGLTDSQISAIAVAPNLPTTVYVGTSGTVFKSTDAGVNWIATNLNTAFVRALVVDPTNSSVVYAGSNAGIFKTTDGGSSWTRLIPDITFSLAIDPGTPTVVYAGVNFGILKTTNAGGNWNQVFASGQVRALAIDPANTAIVYAGRTNGVVKTTNSGASWANVNTGLGNINVRTLAIVPTATSTIYAGTFGGVFKTTDAAANWSAVNNGFLLPYTDNVPRLPQISAMVIDPFSPSTLYVGATNGGTNTGAYALTAILKSTDGGANWTAITNGFGGLNNGFLALAVDPITPARVYAGNIGDVDGFVIKVNPSGTAFPFASYLGGGRIDNGRGIALDPSGDLYIGGFTGSTDFPATTGAYQTTLLGALDLFVTKISAATNTIVYSTYLGGNGFDDGVVGIAVDSAGNAYVNGRTSSTDFPVTPGAFQTTIGNRGTASNTDESITKLNSTGTALVYSSYLGGAGDEHLTFVVGGSKIAVDAAGSAYLVGVTDDSNGLPVFDFLNGGAGKTYIAKIDGITASYSITGRLMTAANAPIAGILVEVVDGQGFSRGARSDNQGFYSLISLPPGDYTVTPSKFATTGNHYIFTPTSRTFTGLNSDQTAADFAGTQVYNIQGQISSSTVPGVGIFDVTVTLSGSASGTVVSDADGRYSFEDLLPGNYVVTPSKPGFTFNPVNRTFTNLNADQFTADFTTASTVFFTVSGRAADQANNSVSNVVISMVSRPQRGARRQTTQTDANGNYSFPNLQSGGNYTFLATKPLFSFTPQNPTLSSLGANQTLNFLVAPVTGLVGKIAFATDQGINVMNADTTGETNVITNGRAPTWSPDGSKIAFTSNRDAIAPANFSDLYVMNADGTGLIRLTNSPLEDDFPSWSPDQQQITYSYGDLECNGVQSGPQPDVLVINADGTSSRNLTNTVLPDGISDWSPGGSSIAFIRASTGGCGDGGDPNIYAMDSGGGNERLLVNSPDPDFGPAYSPDGSLIAYVRENSDPSISFSNSSLYVMNADGTDQTKIGPDFNAADDARPAWSPDGTRIVFSGNLPGEFGPEQVFVVNVDGSGFAQLTSGGTGRNGPSWQHYSISGRVNGNINGLPVTMVLAGTLTRVTQSDANGNYVFGNLTPGGNYSVTPVSTSFVFTPPKIDVNNLVGNQIANFASTAAIPAPTPPLADDFVAAQRDPAKWNLGTQTQPLGAFDSQVSVVQQSGRLVITPRTNLPGLHYNGYVAVNSFDFQNGTATVQVEETATNGADTIFAIGSDLENFTRFVVRAGDGAPGVSSGRNKPRRGGVTAPQLIFQVVVGGQLTSLSIPYNPIEHRHMRFRHEPLANAIIFETSPDNATFTERHRVTLVRSVSALTAELSAGTSTATDPPGQTVFDNFQLVTNTFQFSAPSFSITEGNAPAQLSVTRTGNTSTAATVEYSSFDETASQRTKYILATGTLSFAPGESTKSLSVLVVDNLLVEGPRTLSLQLVDSAGSGLNSPGRAVLNIVDNDTTPPTTNPLDHGDAQFYVRQHYYDFLSRMPDQSGLDFWTNQVTGCGGDAQCRAVKQVNVSAAYFLSIEFQETGFFVHRFYNAALNRSNGLPRYLEFLRDTQTIGRGVVVGTSGWEAQLEANKASYANQFVLRPEFIALYPLTMTPAQFVDALYAHAAVVPSAADRQLAIDEFATPAGARLRVARRVIENQTVKTREFNRAFVLAQYFGYLRRNPDDAPDNNLDGFNFWLGKLNRANGNFVDSEMVKSFIVSGEYRQRFGP